MIIKSVTILYLMVTIKHLSINKLKVIMPCTTHHMLTKYLMDCTDRNQCHYHTTIILIKMVITNPSRMTSMFITVVLVIYTCSKLIAIVEFTRLQQVLPIRLLLAQINMIQAACTSLTCT